MYGEATLMQRWVYLLCRLWYMTWPLCLIHQRLSSLAVKAAGCVGFLFFFRSECWERRWLGSYWTGHQNPIKVLRDTGGAYAPPGHNPEPVSKSFRKKPVRGLARLGGTAAPGFPRHRLACRLFIPRAETTQAWCLHLVRTPACYHTMHLLPLLHIKGLNSD